MRAILNNIYSSMKTIIAPELRYSQVIYERILKDNIQRHYNWLDIGCGHSLLPEWRSQAVKWFIDNSKQIIGVDNDFEALKKHQDISNRVRGDASYLPFKDNAFEFITANLVVEHFDDPETQFKEIARVLRPGGIFIFHTPNSLGYFTMLGRLFPDFLKRWLILLLEGRKDEDVFKTYYNANSEKSINKLARRTGFSIRDIKMITSSAEFAVIPPLAFIELVWIRILMTKTFRPLRTNIIAVLKKSDVN